MTYHMYCQSRINLVEFCKQFGITVIIQNKILGLSAQMVPKLWPR